MQVYIVGYNNDLKCWEIDELINEELIITDNYRDTLGQVLKDYSDRPILLLPDKYTIMKIRTEGNRAAIEVEAQDKEHSSLY